MSPVAPAVPRAAVAAFMGLAALFGLAGLLDGLTDIRAWAPVALTTAVALVALLLSERRALSVPAKGALAGGALLLAWAALSMTWAESVDQAWVEAARLGFYGIMLLFGALAVRTAPDAVRVAAALTAGLGLFTAVAAASLLLGDGPSMFREFRLEDPLGYINGMAGLLAMAFWALAAAAESGAPPWLRGAALALAALALDLLVLTQSRAGAPAMLAGGVVALAVFPDRIRRGWMLALAAVAAAVAMPELLDVYDQLGGDRELPTEGAVRGAAVAAWVTALAAGVAWAFASRVDVAALRPRVRHGAAAGLVAIPLLALVLATAAIGNPIDYVSDQYEAFTSLEVDEDESTRLASGGGFRYDLWKIGLRQFEDHPLRGIGAGNYDTTYYKERENPQPAPNPHSLHVQVLGELGLVGFAALLAFIGCAALCLWRLRGSPPGERFAYVSAGAVLAAWFTHTSIDWLHEVAGVSAVALVAAAVILGRSGPEDTPRVASRATSALVLVAAVAVVAAGIGRLYAAEWYRDRGSDQLRDDPTAALRDAERSVELNPESLDARYIVAAAQARLGRYPVARQILLDAAAKEPSDYVPWVLLGDLAVRRGAQTDAEQAYSRAEALNPYDTNFSVSEGEAQLRDQ